MEKTNKTHRRRGKALEDAILDATWQVIHETGYANMTMDDIAKTAHTNKNTIYRRWKTKFDVTTAALRKNVPVKKFTAPDTGSLRGDLIELLAAGVPIVKLIGMKNIKEIARDRLSAVQNARQYSPKKSTEKAKQLSTDNLVVQYVMALLNRAYKRGELASDPQTFDVTIMNLPILLILSRVISESDYNLQTVVFLVDKILLPVFNAQ
ncbi:MAG: TetR/AcrR family transcriptional regulator [Lentilactobacillus hilgardii]|jgi:AcrR family transcriptional regulator|uniref:TetR family transcriptional regulator n=1 Tax=Lentilactobacillus hilgardii TaxID=1588 RepID=A0A6P1E6R4_LENHI|nr:helix-turn-helix domain-containing protein [Lentilactobacillus hilgardii]RRG12450.1 MAG: TetR/AcrR family transcriptional regulator [Lactobacillus sp.]EEI70967.1 transcriptional regulator, TetR family [Lentilactobacillus hilgardii ATCC 27305]MBZ2201640.1 TetR family transcriptional regulator [Lentilactobacillus hilgardii]MBZ2202926.1 TetR family transcriptional regulator [Lentilactobacillus hilgardii]MCT3391309.1 TetR/AcrR family transcriptional regulator [Lentilactobacillus hilgardii]